ncbi:MAG TPA: nucleotide exchange factor GrpE [Selenomonas sp.]|nr:nucleotide exchange factor GrpE [Selenomonas sp.]
MKDELKKKDRQRFEDMQKEIADVINNKADEEENQAEEEAEQSPYAADNGESQQPEVDVKNVDELEAEITKLQEAVAAEKERTLRLQADFENFRRRTAKEKEELAAVITQEFLKDMLPLVDNFERAMAAEGKDLETFQKGVSMISTQLFGILKKHGLEPIDTEGKKFDPNFHQAVMRIENPELEDETIAQELQKGYIAKGRVIRPSMVQVVANN